MVCLDGVDRRRPCGRHVCSRLSYANLTIGSVGRLYTFDAPMFELTVCGASAVLRQVLVISVFLPLGAFWSLDWWRRGPKENDGSVYWSWVYPVLLLQLAVIYINTACAKFGPSWSLGTVFMDFLVLEGQVTELARWLRHLISLDVSRALT